ASGQRSSLRPITRRYGLANREGRPSAFRIGSAVDSRRVSRDAAVSRGRDGMAIDLLLSIRIARGSPARWYMTGLTRGTAMVAFVAIIGSGGCGGDAPGAPTGNGADGGGLPL